VPTHAPATPGGIQQVAQEVAEYSYGHAHFGARAGTRCGAPDAPRALFKGAGVGAGSGAASSAASPAASRDARRPPHGGTRVGARGCNRGNVGLAQDPALATGLGTHSLGVPPGNPLAAAVRAGWSGHALLRVRRQLRFLARACNATKDVRYRRAFERGRTWPCPRTPRPRPRASGRPGHAWARRYHRLSRRPHRPGPGVVLRAPGPCLKT